MSSSARIGFLYYVNNISSRDDRGIGVRWPDGDRTDICKSSSDNFSFTHTARSPCDHRGRIPRWPNGDRPIYGIIFPWNFGRWPTGHRQMFGRRPAGRRWMSELPQASADDPANFNCELNLPDHRRMSAGWGLYRRITAGFLPDSMQNWPRGGRAANFAQLWRRLKLDNLYLYNSDLFWNHKC